MDNAEMQSNLNNNSVLLTENCLTFISIQNKNGKPTITVDIKTSNFDNYDHIQQFLVERGAEFFEFPYDEVNMVITTFEMYAELTLSLQNPKPYNL